MEFPLREGGLISKAAVRRMLLIAGTAVAIDPSGKFAYVTNANSSTISMYAIDATTGALTLIGTIGT